VSSNIAIIGKGFGWWNHQKHIFDEVWGINDIFRFTKCDRIFDMHDFEWTYEDCLKHYKCVAPDAVKDEIENRAAVKFKYSVIKARDINKYKIPLYSIREYEHIPSSVEYPRESVLAEVCHNVELLQGTLAYAIAYAIFAEFKSINLFGCTLDPASEWAYQIPSVAFLYGIAVERGLDWYMDKCSGIVDSTFKYGYIESYA